MGERKKKGYQTVLLEEINSRLKAVAENVSDIPDMSDRLTRVEEDVKGVKDDTGVIRSVMTAHSTDIRNLKSGSGS